MTEYELNQQVAERICDDEALNGKPFRRGDCVALLDGNVVAVAKNFEGVLTVLRSLDPDPKRGMVFEVSPIKIDVIR